MGLMGCRAEGPRGEGPMGERPRGQRPRGEGPRSQPKLGSASRVCVGAEGEVHRYWSQRPMMVPGPLEDPSLQADSPDPQAQTESSKAGPSGAAGSSFWSSNKVWKHRQLWCSLTLCSLTSQIQWILEYKDVLYMPLIQTFYYTALLNVGF